MSRVDSVAVGRRPVDVGPSAVGCTGALGNGRATDGNVLNPDVARSARDPKLPGTRDSTLLRCVPDSYVVRVLEQDAVVHRVLQVDEVDARSAAPGHGEDAAATSACNDAFGDDVDGIVATIDQAVVVGHAKCSVTGTDRAIRAGHEIDGCVDAPIEEQSAFTHVIAFYLADRDVADAVRLDDVTAHSRPEH